MAGFGGNFLEAAKSGPMAQGLGSPGSQMTPALMQSLMTQQADGKPMDPKMMALLNLYMSRSQGQDTGNFLAQNQQGSSGGIGSKFGGAAKGALGGAATGTMIAPGIGTAIGAGLGAIGGFFG